MLGLVFALPPYGISFHFDLLLKPHSYSPLWRGCVKNITENGFTFKLKQDAENKVIRLRYFYSIFY
jgi:hypothetical protein